MMRWPDVRAVTGVTPPPEGMLGEARHTRHRVKARLYHLVRREIDAP
jgi:hypothetical protein